VAAQRAEDFLAQGDVEGKRIWKKIVEAIRELQRPQPNNDEQMN
jgi:hypothetical protein